MPPTHIQVWMVLMAYWFTVMGILLYYILRDAKPADVNKWLLYYMWPAKILSQALQFILERPVMWAFDQYDKYAERKKRK